MLTKGVPLKVIFTVSRNSKTCDKSPPSKEAHEGLLECLFDFDQEFFQTFGQRFIIGDDLFYLGQVHSNNSFTDDPRYGERLVRDTWTVAELIVACHEILSVRGSQVNICFSTPESMSTGVLQGWKEMADEILLPAKYASAKSPIERSCLQQIIFYFQGMVANKENEKLLVAEDYTKVTLLDLIEESCTDSFNISSSCLKVRSFMNVYALERANPNLLGYCKNSHGAGRSLGIGRKPKEFKRTRTYVSLPI